MHLAKGFFVLLAVLMMAGPVSAQALEREFLGLSWGDDIRDQSGYALLYAKGDLRYYTQPDTARVVKGFNIAQVVYGTYKHRFYAAFLMIDSMETFDDIKAYMEARYGFPKISWSAAGEQTVYKWNYNAIPLKPNFFPK